MRDMKHNQSRIGFLKFAAAGLVVAALIAAGLFAVPTPARASENPSVAVTPFIRGQNPENPEETLSCPFGRFCYDEGDLTADADKILTRMVQKRLLKSLESRVVPLRQVREADAAVDFGAVEKQTPLEAARSLGRNLEVDYVLVGNVWRYRERIGGPYGVDQPASVAFGLYLLRVEDARSVWEVQFSETQQPLSENLFRAPEFIRRGAKWVTAKELAGHGLDDIMADFPVKSGKK
ncbi:MAG: hypothetical protein R6U97_07085 [Desulfosalsimonas sp.]